MSREHWTAEHSQPPPQEAERAFTVWHDDQVVHAAFQCEDLCRAAYRRGRAEHVDCAQSVYDAATAETRAENARLLQELSTERGKRYELEIEGDRLTTKLTAAEQREKRLREALIGGVLVSNWPGWSEKG